MRVSIVLCVAAAAAASVAGQADVRSAIFPPPTDGDGPPDVLLDEEVRRPKPYSRYSNLLVTAIRVHHAIVDGREYVEQLRQQDALIAANPGPFTPGDSVRELRCQAFADNYTEQARAFAELAIVTTSAAVELYALGPAAQGLSGEVAAADVRGDFESCPKRSDVNCLGDAFRPLDGFCNNVEHAWWGATLEPFKRDLPALYNDGVAELRQLGVDGQKLPSVSYVVAKVHATPADKRSLLDPSLTQLFVIWSHMLAQDLYRVSQYRSATGTCMDCCTPEAADHFACFVKRENGECEQLLRLLPGLHTDCQLLPLSPANQATSYLDASTVYGSSAEDSRRLRSFEAGRLRTGDSDYGLELPPPAVAGPDKCRSATDHLPCFDFGSYGMNTAVIEAAVGIVWLRQHNRLADELVQLNPHWDDSRLFEEARRIVIAQQQHITYNEYLPLLLGRETTRRFGLELETHGAYHGYDRYRNPQTRLGFVSAAYFFMSATADDGYFGDTTFNPHWLYFIGKLEEVVSSSTRNVSQRVDRFLANVLHLRNVNPAEPTTPADDLRVWVLADERYSGVQTYAAFRRACSLPSPARFDDLLADMDADSVTALRDTYANVEDIDLFTGGMSETPLKGAAVGPTFACILAHQYQHARTGDRFWYENFFYPSAFTEAQLAQLRTTTLASILCHNTQVESMQPNPFLSVNEFDNCPLPCEGTVLRDMDLSVFADAEQRPRADITQETISTALAVARQLAEERDAGPPPSLSVPRQGSFIFYFLHPLPASLAISRVAVLLLYATEVLITRPGLFDEVLPDMLDENVLQTLLPAIDVRQIVDQLPADHCLERTWPCDHTTPFRTISGWCNNLEYPSYGSSFITYRRQLLPAYDDGFSAPRTLSADGGALPSTREVSLKVHAGVTLGHSRYTQYVALWGRALQIDMMHTPISVNKNGRPHGCQACDSATSVSADCFPVPVPADDPFFIRTDPYGEPRCLAFARSLLGQLTLGFREQINEVTSFLDASSVYGSDDCTAERLRLHEGGLLRFRDEPTVGVVLPADDADVECITFFGANVCYFSGSAAVNVNPALATLNTISLREHNNMARRLAELNPHWHDERLYQEARRINIAFAQHITYTEWLPKMIGYKMMDEFGLLPNPQSHFNAYDGLCEATLRNELAHTLASTLLAIENATVVLHADGGDQLLPADEFYGHPELVQQPGFVERLLQGLARQPAGQYDRFVTVDHRDGFPVQEVEFAGSDVLAFTIQRGRDHGIPSYARFVESLGGASLSTFDDLLDTVDAATVDALRDTYESVRDVDLLTGLVAERPLLGAIVGPTAARLLAEQFRRLRNCDRFWYENADVAGAFTREQLAEIRKVSLAKAICKTLPDDAVIQPDAFVLPDERGNCPVSCDSLPDVHLAPWQEACVVGGLTVAPGTDARLSPCVSCTCTLEGTICHSFRVRNCVTLFETFSLAAVIADDACVIQCYPFIRLQETPHHG